MKKIIITAISLFFILESCNEKKEVTNSTEIKSVKTADTLVKTEKTEETIILSTKHNPNFILCDLDGDDSSDRVEIVLNTKNEKYGLKITFGNGKTEYLGLGKEVLGQGFDDMSWIGIFEKAPKGEVYFNNVNDEGDIISEEEVKESDKIRLPNDGIFIHAEESCGGGVIYLNKGKFEWIQQE
ncbi:hypothetical protein J5295_08755 [Riemerella anatipestifer]|uniref:Uncharacterized protein n=1 Tax=Riemerella anatipestifer TaxID=34085 RepID=A0AAP6HHB4_RIEAN|nr:hypothetical protein [Riemerella anatipestifer]ADQ83009.1 hypothetical protein Riean_1856 [Riemerella anatipestifer ATCC 11845 = DSM 15868]ADZ11477.1 hypothetical protein RIA_0296 [Riemerella anatipestifer RA-GD]AGC41003.1 hypothetical protein G148_1699 [Riemerella anatipestifer RA-CH-2]AKP70174.1 hypothetical protein CG08_2099 [Riemerella anatipestifer]AKP72153.1 hypothetical protein CG09_2065 [Riemerella anatipestifer]